MPRHSPLAAPRGLAARRLGRVASPRLLCTSVPFRLLSDTRRRPERRRRTSVAGGALFGQILAYPTDLTGPAGVTPSMSRRRHPLPRPPAFGLVPLPNAGSGRRPPPVMEVTGRAGMTTAVHAGARHQAFFRKRRPGPTKPSSAKRTPLREAAPADGGGAPARLCGDWPGAVDRGDGGWSRVDRPASFAVLGAPTPCWRRRTTPTRSGRTCTWPSRRQARLCPSRMRRADPPEGGGL